MRCLAGLTLSVAIALTPVTAQDRPPLESIVPSDTAMLMLIDEMPAFLETWPKTPLGEAWNDPAVKRFLAPLRESMEIERLDEMTRETTGHDLTEILDGLTGQLLVIVNDAGAILDEGEDVIPDIAVIAEIGDHQAMFRDLMARDLEQMIEEAEEGEQIVEIEEEFQGQTLHIRRSVSSERTEDLDAWAIAGDVMILAEPASLLKETVGNLKDGAAAPISETAAFRKMRARTPESDLLIYVNAEPFLPLIEEALKKSFSQGGGGPPAATADTEGAEPATPSPFQVDPQAMYDALGLDVLEGLYISTRVGEGATDVDFGLSYSGDEGILKVLAYAPGPVQLLEFVPEDVIEASVTNFDFSEAWQALRELLESASPEMAAQFSAQLQQMTQVTGIDLEKSLISSLGDNMVAMTFTRLPEDPDPQAIMEDVEGEAPAHPPVPLVDELFGIGIDDRQAMELLLGQVRGLLAMWMVAFDEHDYLGTPVWSVTSPGAGPSEGVEQTFAYTLTDDHVIFSTGSLGGLHRVIGLIENPGRSVWKRPEVKAALKSLSDRDASALAYVDFPSLLMQLLEGMVMAQSFTVAAADDEADEERLVDPGALPDKSVLQKYFGVAVSSISKDGGGLYSTFRLIHARP
jgi:hypothetical protein